MIDKYDPVGHKGRVGGRIHRPRQTQMQYKGAFYYGYEYEYFRFGSVWARQKVD